VSGNSQAGQRAAGLSGAAGVTVAEQATEYFVQADPCSAAEMRERRTSCSARCCAHTDLILSPQQFQQGKRNGRSRRESRQRRVQVRGAIPVGGRRGQFLQGDCGTWRC
jgi:hypothetical protein